MAECSLKVTYCLCGEGRLKHVHVLLSNKHIKIYSAKCFIIDFNPYWKLVGLHKKCGNEPRKSYTSSIRASFRISETIFL